MPDVPPAPAPAPRRAAAADRLWLMAASVGGLGYLPWAPGTWGSLAGVAAWVALRGQPLATFVAVTAAVTLLAVVVSHRAEQIYGAHDVGHIVIDEVAGMLCTAIGLPCTPATVLGAFCVFRVLDATKPPPIGTIDRRVPGGLGVVLDDVVAGLIGCLMCHGARRALGEG